MYENLFKSPLQRVFVYGTLKRGEPNHSLISNSENGFAKFLGLGKTLKKYPLVIATKYNIPFLLKKAGIGHQIIGEVYDVDSKMMASLDKLEDHPNLYLREEDDILIAPESKLNNGSTFENIGEESKAWIYFLPNFQKAFLDLLKYESYSNNGDHGLKYTERYNRTSTAKDELLSQSSSC